MQRWRRLTCALVAVALSAPVAAHAAGPKAVWLCRPGQTPDPCAVSLTTTRVSPTGARVGVVRVSRPRRPRFDCFYVYPTISDQTTVNANLHIDGAERSIALYQAARYSQVCRVYAPMYRQLTLSSIGRQPLPPGSAAIAYSDVRAAWLSYLRRYNHGRGVVLIGHSQGAFLLEQLIASEIDPRPTLRRRLISAILLGGNVTVQRGHDAGGSFRHVRACHSARQVGCVVAFSTFDGPVPLASKFGRTAAAGLSVLCTNPAALGGGQGLLDPIYPTAPFAPASTFAVLVRLLGALLPRAPTPWVSIPGAYDGRCSSRGGADVLQITPRHGAPVFAPSPDATWGLHVVDGNIALGNLVQLVGRQGAAYSHHGA